MPITKTGMEQANTDKVKTIESQRLKEKLLESLESAESTPSEDISTEDALYEIRQHELNHLVTNE